MKLGMQLVLLHEMDKLKLVWCRGRGGARGWAGDTQRDSEKSGGGVEREREAGKGVL